VKIKGLPRFAYYAFFAAVLKSLFSKDTVLSGKRLMAKNPKGDG
jgi:hypothetical protein